MGKTDEPCLRALLLQEYQVSLQMLSRFLTRSHALSRALTRALALQTSALRVLQTACESIERLIATVDFAVGAEVVDRK